MLLFFSVVSVIANMQGIKSIARTNVILCVIMVISLLTAFAAVVPNMTIQRIFPILGHGVSNTFFTGISNIFIFNDNHVVTDNFIILNIQFIFHI